MTASRKQPATSKEEIEHRLAEVTIKEAGEAIFWVDVEGRFHRVNQAACVLHGMTRDKLLGGTVWDVTSAYTGDEWNAFWKTLRREKSMIKESYHLRKDGSRFPVEVLVSYVEVDGSEFCCAFVRDISRRKRAEQTIRTAEERLRTIFEASNDAIFIVDLDEDRIVQVNRQACRITGYAREELEGLPVSRIHPEEMSRLKKFGEAVYGEGAGRSEEFSCLAKSGSSVPVEMSASVLRFQEEDYLMVIARDITERKQAERELTEAYEQVKQLKDRLMAENLYLQDEIRGTYPDNGIITKDAGFQEVLEKARRVAGTSAAVLIFGETGTGKELVARGIHDYSARRDRPLVKVNCAALPTHLIESELFGHEKGAFTGAASRRQGRFELASGGTLFLDEIGELALELQSKLLRVLQEGEFERLGGTETIEVDVRIITATNRNLARAVEAGEFREDLYYRLNVFPLKVPPLRERPTDIPVLARHFVEKHAPRIGVPVRRIAEATLRRMQTYPWPGNVRELENLIERSLIVSTGSELMIEDSELRSEPVGPPRQRPDEASGPQTLGEMEKSMIERALDESGGVVEGKSGAATRLGMPPSTLRERMRKYGLSRKR